MRAPDRYVQEACRITLHAGCAADGLCGLCEDIAKALRLAAAEAYEDAATETTNFRVVRALKAKAAALRGEK